MEWQPTPYTVPLLGAAFASFAFAAYAVRNRTRGETRLVRSFIAVAVGSGLGLWLVHRIVTESGGEVTIESREPRGALVSMWFPAPGDGDR